MDIRSFAEKKKTGEKATVVTCYDTSFARLLAASPVDALLVGDSVAMVVHGHATTLPADLAMMTLHTAAVARGAGDKLVIADLPFLAHRRGIPAAVEAAGALLQAGAHAVKLEGAAGNTALIAHLVESGVPVMGHIGLTPQFVNAFGGFKVQGRDAEAADRIVDDAQRLEAAGCFALVLEGVPAALGARVTAQAGIPVIGIGAGPVCDGQVLVLYDLLGLTAPLRPRFVRPFADGTGTVLEALAAYVAAVHDGSFPSEKESYR